MRVPKFNGENLGKVIKCIAKVRSQKLMTSVDKYELKDIHERRRYLENTYISNIIKTNRLDKETNKITKKI